MARFNIFDNIVRNENDLTELLRNLLLCSSRFRQLFLTNLLSAECASQMLEVDIKTQEGRDECGRPDLVIQNEMVYALIEVKAEDGCRLTANQRDRYFEWLLGNKVKRKKWLVFLVPKSWRYGKDLKECLRHSEVTHPNSGIETRIVTWEDVFKIVHEDLPGDPILEQFAQLLSDWFIPKPIVFSKDEVHMLFSKDFAGAFCKMTELIEQVQNKAKKNYSTEITGSGLELYFKNQRGQRILQFGFWAQQGKEKGLPLWFGVRDDYSASAQKAFRDVYGDTEPVEGNWRLARIPQEDFQEGKDAAEEVWQRIYPILDAIKKADPMELSSTRIV